MTGDSFLFLANHPALDFLNTELVEHGRRVDRLRTVGDLTSWLIQAGLMDASDAAIPTTTGADPGAGHQTLQRVRIIRSALRDAVTARSAHEPVPDGVLRTMNNQLRAAPGHFQLLRAPDGLEVGFAGAGSAAAGLLAPVLAAAVHLLTEVGSGRVRVCSNPDCILFFLDASRNHGRRWCSMSSCGGRAKSTARQRRRTAPATSRGE